MKTMVRRLRQAGAVGLGLLALVSMTSTAIAAACSRTPTIAIASAAALPSYNPFLPAPSTQAIVSITNRGNAACTFAVSFLRPSLPVVMTKGATTSTLPYSITSGGSSLIDTSGAQSTAPHVNVTIPSGGIANVIVNVAPVSSQVVDSGNYKDTTVDVEVFDVNGGQAAVSTHAFNVTETVLDACNMGLPSLTSMDFSGAISNGLVSSSATQTATIAAQCTATTRVRLSGAPLQLSSAVTAPSGFANYIDWNATATLGNAKASFTTTGATSIPFVTSAKKNATPNTAFTDPNMTIAVHLMTGGLPPLAGAYSGVLTIQIDPSF